MDKFAMFKEMFQSELEGVKSIHDEFKQEGEQGENMIRMARQRLTALNRIQKLIDIIEEA